MSPDLLPLRAVALQILCLLVAVAIESKIFHERLKMAPKQSVQIAASINLLATVVGWLALFIFLGLTPVLPVELESALMSFILFDRWTPGFAQLLIMVASIAFFATLVVKQLGWWGLRWLLKMPPDQPKPSDSDEEIPPPPSTLFRVPRKQIRRRLRPQLGALVLANALSFSAILGILLFRMLVYV